MNEIRQHGTIQLYNSTDEQALLSNIKAINENRTCTN